MQVIIDNPVNTAVAQMTDRLLLLQCHVNNSVPLRFVFIMENVGSNDFFKCRLRFNLSSLFIND